MSTVETVASSKRQNPYRLYFLSHQDTFLNVREFEEATDKQALIVAAGIAGRQPAELWCKDRLVAKMEGGRVTAPDVSAPHFLLSSSGNTAWDALREADAALASTRYKVYFVNELSVAEMEPLTADNDQTAIAEAEKLFEQRPKATGYSVLGTYARVIASRRRDPTSHQLPAPAQKDGTAARAASGANR